MEDFTLKDVSDSFEKTLVSSELSDAVINIAEVSLDNLLDNGVLREIPIISTLVGIGKTTNNIRNQLFLKKIIYFISELNNVSQKERQRLISDIESSKEYKVKVGEKLLYIIDKCADYQSAELVAKLFCAFLEEKISYDQFLKSSSIVSNILIADLIDFLDNEKKYRSAKDLGDLIGIGLCSLEIEPVDVSVEKEADWEMERNYSADVSGGELYAVDSEIGKVIKSVLKGKI